MTRLDDLWKEVTFLYNQKLDTREDWADWLYPNHVIPVTNNAKKIAEQKGANVELSQVAALLHDVADYKMKRADSNHETESLAVGRELMQKHGYTDQEIQLVIDDAVKYHSCHDNERPKSLEGLVLATADSLAHLQTDFYFFAAVGFGQSGRSFDQYRTWLQKKIERDMYSKISFDDIREQVRPNYDAIKSLLESHD